MQDKELSLVVWSWGILLGAIGFLIVFAGGILGYMFKQHRQDNDCDHTEIKDLIDRVNGKIVKVEDSIKTDIVRLHERIDKHLEVE